MTCGPSTGRSTAGRVVDRARALGAGRVVRAAHVRERPAEVLVLVAERPDERDALAVRVLESAVHRLDDGALLDPRLGRVGRVVEAVEAPGVDVERHVDHVEADVGSVGQGVDDGLEEEEPGVLPGADVHERDVRRHPGHAEPVRRGGHRARDVGAVTAAVVVDGVDAAVELARTVQLGAGRVGGDVGDEVAREPCVEVRGQVGVASVDAGVEDADEHPPVARLLGAGRVRSDHAQAPEPRVERVEPLRPGRGRHGGRAGLTRRHALRLPDDVGAGDAEHALGRGDPLHEAGLWGPVSGDDQRADGGVLPRHRARPRPRSRPRRRPGPRDRRAAR